MPILNLLSYHSPWLSSTPSSTSSLLSTTTTTITITTTITMITTTTTWTLTWTAWPAPTRDGAAWHVHWTRYRKWSHWRHVCWRAWTRGWWAGCLRVRAVWRGLSARVSRLESCWVDQAMLWWPCQSITYIQNYLIQNYFIQSPVFVVLQWASHWQNSFLMWWSWELFSLLARWGETKVWSNISWFIFTEIFQSNVTWSSAASLTMSSGALVHCLIVCGAGSNEICNL